MKIKGIETRSIWPTTDGFVEVIDQTKLPHGFGTVRLTSMAAAARAISNMTVRGAPLIGATGAYGLALSLRADPSDEGLDKAHAAAACRRGRRRSICAGRSTACATPCAIAREASAPTRPGRKRPRFATRMSRPAGASASTVLACFAAIAAKKSGPLNILTHCNAGWLACVDWGTALAPIYMAHDHGIPLHVWVDETRPRNQGASLTAFELGSHGVRSRGRRRQCRRSSDAAGQGGYRHRRRGSRDRGTATSPTRSARI